MAQKVIYQLVDDLDQSPLGDGEGETIVFGLDGVEYEIDLSAAHAKDLRDALETFVAAARPRARRSAGTTPRRATPVKRDLDSVRAWANENGFTVSSRGRIPAAVSEAYHAANN
jgi:hypothetical protein